jgi:hypothetical protein
MLRYTYISSLVFLSRETENGANHLFRRDFQSFSIGPRVPGFSGTDNVRVWCGSIDNQSNVM